MTKSIENQFADWESTVFGYGYGTGEEYILPALKSFFAAFENERSYSHKTVETAIGPAAAWLLINTLCHADILEYGTSPRYGWVTDKGARLKKFIEGHSNEELIAMCEKTEDYIACYPDACNCGPNGYQPGVKCQNAFW